MAGSPGLKPFRIVGSSWMFVAAHLGPLFVLALPMLVAGAGLYAAMLLTAPEITLAQVENDAAEPGALAGHLLLFSLPLWAVQLIVGSGIMAATRTGSVPPRPYLAFGRRERALFLAQLKFAGAALAFGAVLALAGGLAAAVLFGLMGLGGFDLASGEAEGGPLLSLLELSVVALFLLAAAFFLLRAFARLLILAPHAAETGVASLKATWQLTEGRAGRLFLVLVLIAVSQYAALFIGLIPVYGFANAEGRAAFDILLGRVPEVVPALTVGSAMLAALLYAATMTLLNIFLWVALAKTYTGTVLTDRVDRALAGPKDAPGEAVAAALEGTGFGRRTRPPEPTRT